MPELGAVFFDIRVNSMSKVVSFIVFGVEEVS